MLTNKLVKSTLIKSVALAATLLCSATTWAEEVTIGYFGAYNPMAYAINTKIFEKETGYEIKWRKFDSGAKAITAMASGSIDMSAVGSSPIASAASQGIEMELIWILENIADAEALVVRDGSGIKGPASLKGKKIAVPFVSTTHFHMLFALEQFGLSETDVKLINMQPSAIMAAWERKDIDGAFIWDPALGKIKQSGSVLVTSKDLSAWGTPTFDGIVASKDFSAENEDFIVKFLSTLAKVDREYVDNQATITAESEMVTAIANQIGGEPEGVVEAMKLYEFLDFESQTSCQWLGCGAEGGATSALKATSEFLLKEKKIMALKPDYSVFVNSSFAEKASAM